LWEGFPVLTGVNCIYAEFDYKMPLFIKKKKKKKKKKKRYIIKNGFDSFITPPPTFAQLQRTLG